MTVRGETEAVARGDLLTPQDFSAWEQANANDLGERDARNAAAVQDAVIRAVQRMRQSGTSLADAGDILMQRFPYGHRDGVAYTPSAVRSAQRAIGWRASRPKQAKDCDA